MPGSDGRLPRRDLADAAEEIRKLRGRGARREASDGDERIAALEAENRELGSDLEALQKGAPLLAPH